MKNLLLLLLIISLFSCEKNDNIDVLPEYKVNMTINLDLPQYINLQTPTGWAYASGGIQGIFVQNTGTGNPNFKAFERACPNYDCSNPMTFDGSLKLKCSCDDSEYSILDGSPQNAGNKNYAREYKVTVINSKTLNISNF
ncbi:MAG TPA: hypothetical protein VJ970_04265 [Flavobacteriaceae bacterium]|nr:hypothetical protein [Flavobacteriaceae bacterium]